MKLYRGNFIYAPEPGTVSILEQGYLGVSESGEICFAEKELPEECRKETVQEFGDSLVIPGFVDLHLHTSQLPICGLGFLAGEDWFGDYCYPAESSFQDTAYAHRIQRRLINQLIRHGITRANLMGTIHTDAALDLFWQLEESGLSARIGKMNSDWGAFGNALEDTASSKEDTLRFLEGTQGGSGRVKPSLCPEFAPACSAPMMEFLGKLAREQGLLVHSHMAEGDFDVEMVANTFPEEKTYGKVYDRFGLLQGSAMAHCLCNTPEDIALMAERNATAVHCPMAALNSASPWMFQARDYLKAGVKIGLGSDIGGGHTLNMMQVMLSALHISGQVSREDPLTVNEVFYMATKGGGSLFGKVGSFEPGYEFDALVIDDSRNCFQKEYTLYQRLIRFIYCGEPADIRGCWCRGRKLQSLPEEEI